VEKSADAPARRIRACRSGESGKQGGGDEQG